MLDAGDQFDQEGLDQVDANKCTETKLNQVHLDQPLPT